MQSPFEEHRDKIEQVIIDDDDDESMKGEWLDFVYGEKSNLKYEEWAQKVCKKPAKVIFSASKIRKQIMLKAKVDYKL